MKCTLLACAAALMLSCNLFPETAPTVDAGMAGSGGASGGSSGAGGATGGNAGMGGTGGMAGDAGCVPQTSMVTAAADTYIVNIPPTSTHGNEPVLITSSTSANAQRRVLLRFDIDLPAGAELLSAQIALRLLTNQGGNHELGAHRVLTEWTESASWSNSGSGSWTGSGGDFVQQPTASQLIDAGTATGGILEWDVTADVKEMVDLTFANNGWLLRDLAANLNGEQLQFGSSEALSSGDQPMLVLEYRLCDGGS